MSHIPNLTPQAIAERKMWQYKTIAYTHGNKSQVGALLLAICGRLSKPPCFHPRGAKITADGALLALYRSDDRAQWEIRRVYENIEDFTLAFRGLATVCKLDDVEQEAMFTEIRKWIFKDDRAKSTLD